MNSGAFGEGFPYTNFHDLNLDWIIKVMKDFFTKYPEVIETLDNKVNAPLDDKYGEAGQLLLSLGNGNTEWKDVDEKFYPYIVEAVNTWLEDHPEYVTTVEDNSLTIQKFTHQLRTETEHDYVSPQMHGAVADGVTDDTSAIVSAMAEAIETGKTLYFPTGVYLTDSIEIDHTIKIEGSGVFETIIKPLASATLPVFYTTDYDQSTRLPIYVEFENISIDGEGNTNNAVDGINICVELSYFNHVSVVNMKGYGIYLSSRITVPEEDREDFRDAKSVLPTLESVRVAHCGKDCVCLDNCIDANVSNCSFSTASQGNIYDGTYDEYCNLRVTNESGIKCVNSHFYRNSTALNDYACSVILDSTNNSSLFTNCHFECGTETIIKLATKAFFVNCYIYMSQSDNLVLIGQQGCRFIGCRFGGSTPRIGGTTVPVDASIKFISGSDISNIFVEGCQFEYSVVDFRGIGTNRGHNHFGGYIGATTTENIYLGTPAWDDTFDVFSFYDYKTYISCGRLPEMRGIQQISTNAGFTVERPFVIITTGTVNIKAMPIGTPICFVNTQDSPVTMNFVDYNISNQQAATSITIQQRGTVILARLTDNMVYYINGDIAVKYTADSGITSDTSAMYQHGDVVTFDCNMLIGSSPLTIGNEYNLCTIPVRHRPPNNRRIPKFASDGTLDGVLIIGPDGAVTYHALTTQNYIYGVTATWNCIN